MNFSDFEKLIHLMVESNNKISSALETGIDLIEFNETQNQINSLLLHQIMTTEGVDWFNWFLYEKGVIEDGIGRSDMKAFTTINEEEIEIVADTKELHDYLKTNSYFKCDQK